MVTFVEQAEKHIESLTQGIVEKAHQMDEFVGDRPLFGKKRTPQEQEEYYNIIYDDSDEWDHLIEQYGMKHAIKFALDMEKRRRKTAEEEI